MSGFYKKDTNRNFSVVANNLKKTRKGPCQIGVCDGSGYIWTNHRKTMEFVAFRCKCDIVESNIPYYDPFVYPEYDRHK